MILRKNMIQVNVLKKILIIILKIFGDFVEIKGVLMELPHDRFLEAIVNDENLANIDFSEF